MAFLKKYWGVLRRVKALHVANNLFHWGALKNNRNLYQKFGIRRSVVLPLSHRSIGVSGTDIPWLDKPGSEAELKRSDFRARFSAEVADAIEKWPQAGYLRLEKFFSEERVDQINRELDQILKDGSLEFDYTNSRIMNAWKASNAVRNTAKDPKVIGLLSFLLGKPVAPFQTISFFRGSEQNTHSDFIHMTTEPKGYLIAIWVALEDIGLSQGPLHYYPGSHQLPYILGEDFEHSTNAVTVGDDLYGNYEKKIEEVVRTNGLKKEIFTAKKGDMLVWHANLLHGGEPVTDDSSTRKSLVVHYFCEGDVLCYHEITQRPALFPKI